MVLFWFLAAVLLAVVLLVLAWPLLRPAPKLPAGDDYSLNLTVYREQLQEVSEEQESGELTPEQARGVREDIEDSLLREIPEEAGSAPPAPSSRAPRWTAAVIAVLVTASTLYLYLDLGDPAAAKPGGGAPTSVNAMVSQLEQRLKSNPDDVDGWLMLERSYMVLHRYNDAVKVMKRLHQQVGNQPPILVRYAHALAMAAGGSFSGKPEVLVKQVLEQEPNNPSALWMAGIAANERGDYRTAIAHWQKLLPQLSGQKDARQRVHGLIAMAKSQLQGSGQGAAPAAAQQTASQQKAGSGGKAAAKSDGAVHLHVSLADSLRSKVDPDATLYIFARAPTGLPMPLAVVKRRAGDLPLDVVLNDSQAMSPQHTISGQDKVDLVARISNSGSVRGRSGDLQGEKDGVTVGGGSNTVPLVIDTKIP